MSTHAHLYDFFPEWRVRGSFLEHFCSYTHSEHTCRTNECVAEMASFSTTLLSLFCLFVLASCATLRRDFYPITDYQEALENLRDPEISKMLQQEGALLQRLYKVERRRRSSRDPGKEYVILLG